MTNKPELNIKKPKFNQHTETNILTIKKWLVNNDCQDNHIFSAEIGTNSAGVITVNPDIIVSNTKYAYSNIFAVYRKQSKQEQLSIYEWAIKILNDYLNWYNKQYKKQQFMNVTKIAMLLEKTPKDAVFSSETYQDFILNNLSWLNYKEIAFNYLLDLSLFTRKLVDKYQFYPQINADVFFHLVVWTSQWLGDNYQNIATKLQRYFYQTLIVGNKTMPKIIFKVPNDVYWLDTMLDDYNEALNTMLNNCHDETQIKLPLPMLLVNQQVANYHQLQYVCRSQADMNQLINMLLLILNGNKVASSIIEANKALNNVINNKKIRINLGEYQQYLTQRIDILRNSFAEITILSTLAEKLTQIVDKCN